MFLIVDDILEEKTFSIEEVLHGHHLNWMEDVEKEYANHEGKSVIGFRAQIVD